METKNKPGGRPGGQKKNEDKNSVQNFVPDSKRDYSPLIDELFPQGVWEQDGENKQVYSPFREDRNLGACIISKSTGLFYDRTTGESAKLLDVIKKVRGVDDKQAVVIARGKQVSTQTFDYGDGFRVHRINHEYGKTFTSDVPRDGLKPLYKRNEIQNNSDARILVVEGEKAADAHQLDGFIVTTWMNGAGAVEKADWSILKNRDVVLWPDNDDAGKNAMAKVARAIGSPVKIALVDDLREKADIADLPLSVVRERIGKAKPFENEVSANRPGDSVNASLLTRRIRGRWLFNVDRGRWLHYETDTGIWQYDDGILREVPAILEDLRQITLTKTGNNDFAEWVRWVRTSDNVSRMRAAISLCEVSPELAVRNSELDADDWILSVSNGVVDLRTGELREHSPDDLLTKQAPVKWEPGAGATIFARFLSEILPDDLTRSYVQKVVGLSLTGSMAEQKFWIAYGDGANGKSTLFETIHGLLGDYSRMVNHEVFLRGKADAGAASPQLAQLDGARLVLVSEIEAGFRLHQSLVKQITGGDTLTVRRLYEPPFEMQPKCKIILYANARPTVPNGGFSLWRRLRAIPFLTKIEDGKRDLELKSKLRAEWPGILQWAYAGLVAYRREGLPDAVQVSDATRNYEDESDAIARFLTEECERETGAKAPAGKLQSRYREWCHDNGEKPLPTGLVKDSLASRGIKYNRMNDGRFYVGVRLLTEDEPTEADF